ncbi:MAG: hypothetical protein MUP45_01620 [Candidatus Marinimicrobia bacterium]|nr:hypothetical protein [Candidatus Neomarinimicrobiota bacterium]
MVRDPRGGHNRYKVNEKLFKIWSHEMAYVLGFIYADGCLIDSCKSSRTQYLSIASKDSSILHKINQALGCKKPLYKVQPKIIKYPNGIYKNSLTYVLRFGNKVMFNDLINLGLTPRKSLSLKLPQIPSQYFSSFLRGYFDGDGCLTLSRPYKNKNRAYRVRLVLTSGSKQFLNDIGSSISEFTEIQSKNIYQQVNSFHLVYCKTAALKILRFMYSDIEQNKLYLDRKYERYLHLLKIKKIRSKTCLFVL